MIVASTVKPLRMATFLARRHWERTATRHQLRSLPILPCLGVVLVVGLVAPFLTRADLRPTDLTLSLARARLAAYAEALPAAETEVGPMGPIFSQRPALYWPAHEAAEGGYRVQITRDDGTPWILGSDGEVSSRTSLLVPAPRALETGSAYRFEVWAIGTDGETLGAGDLPHASGTFAVVEPTEKLRHVRECAGRALDPLEANLVLLGAYAEIRSLHDVMTALLSAHESHPRRFERLILEQDEARRYGDWLTRSLAQMLRSATP